MKGKMKGGMLYLVIVGILLIAILFGANQNFAPKEQLTYSDLITGLAAGTTKDLTIRLSGDYIAYVTFSGV